jgi:SAM-dependent methyltransferase
MTHPVYDTIGLGYAERRRPEPAVMDALGRALGDAATVLNVGAGTGSYEPADREVVALEPSREMIRQRDPAGPPVVQASAEAIPFADGSFDAALAVLTLHHWSDLARGLREMARVAARRVVILTWDPEHRDFWLTRDYFPDILALNTQLFPSFAALRRHLGPGRSEVLPIPHDCRDGFLGAYWRRPAAYLDPAVRAAMSGFSMITGVEPRIERLAADLADGRWHERNRDLLDREELDIGYRIMTFPAHRPPAEEPHA